VRREARGVRREVEGEFEVEGKAQSIELRKDKSKTR